MNVLCSEVDAEFFFLIGMIQMYTIPEILSKKCIIAFSSSFGVDPPNEFYSGSLSQILIHTTIVIFYARRSALLILLPGRAGESRSEARGNIVWGLRRPWKYKRGLGGGGGGGGPPRDWPNTRAGGWVPP